MCNSTSVCKKSPGLNYFFPGDLYFNVTVNTTGAGFYNWTVPSLIRSLKVLLNNGTSFLYPWQFTTAIIAQPVATDNSQNPSDRVFSPAFIIPCVRMDTPATASVMYYNVKFNVSWLTNNPHLDHLYQIEALPPLNNFGTISVGFTTPNPDIRSDYFDFPSIMEEFLPTGVGLLVCS